MMAAVDRVRELAEQRGLEVEVYLTRAGTVCADVFYPDTKALFQNLSDDDVQALDQLEFSPQDQLELRGARNCQSFYQFHFTA